MKKRNIGICIITTTLLMGGHAKATELILAKDHTNVVNQTAEIAAYKSNRPPVNKRLFTSKAVEAEIIRVKKLLTNQKLAWMFENCFPNTLETTVHYRTTNGKPDTFVYTGDIHAMWLRDSGAQVWPYIQLASKDPELKKMLEGVIRRQFKCINIDPYANAFNDGAVGGEWMSDLTDMKPELHERKWEIDSLCYPLRLAYQYWKETGDASIFDSEWIQAITNILSTFKEQQRKEGVGPYKFQRKTERALDTLNNNGLGAPVNPVGLIVSAFRPRRIFARISSLSVTVGIMQAESPEWIPASSTCSMIAPITLVSPSEMQSTSSSVASSRKRSISTGRSSEASTASVMYLRRNSSL